MSEDVTAVALGEFAGLRRVLDVGIRIAPLRAHSAAAAKSLASIIDEFDGVGVRLIGVEAHGSRTHITAAVCLGSIDDIKAAEPCSRQAVLLLQRIVDSLSAHDPAFVQIPAGAGLALDARELQTVG